MARQWLQVKVVLGATMVGRDGAGRNSGWWPWCVVLVNCRWVSCQMDMVVVVGG